MAEPNGTELDPSAPTDPYAREAQTFPVLTQEQVDRVAGYGSEERVEKGAKLFERGQRGADFFLVLDGAVEVFEQDPEGHENILIVQRARQFTGEMDLFNDREILVSGRAAEPTRVARIKRADFRRMVASEPDIGEIIMRAFILRRTGLISHGQGGVELVGPEHHGDTLRLQRFMTRNAYPHRLLDTERDQDAGGFLACFELKPEQLPVVVLPNHRVLRNPSDAELADALGITESIDPDKVYDVAVVGAGPAGLAAAVYAASEGLSTLVLEQTAPGGQAGTSSKIENYLGFPTGISGQALAGRAQAQAQKFGARLVIAREVQSLECGERPYRLGLSDGRTVHASAVVIASGARYRKLDLPNFAKFEGAGIHYAATAMEAQLCGADAVAVVGGGNSAGQAAMFLSRTTGCVHMVIRGDGLAETMSNYLVERITASPHITLHTRTEVTGLEGDDYLRRVVLTNRENNQSETLDIANLFLMIGAEPNTEWLNGCLRRDDKGFVVTGVGADGERLHSPYATSKEGVFAVGDARSGSVKRVASAVGEGSVVVQAIHHFLHPAEA